MGSRQDREADVVERDPSSGATAHHDTMDHTHIHPFWALGDPIRRRILDVLASGEHTAGQIADVINAEFRVSRTSSSKHLRVLRDAGLIDVRAEEQWRWYRLLADGIDALEREIADLREKTCRAIGWDADSGELHDPLRGWAPPRRKGPGRVPRPAMRGAQRTRIFEDGPDEWMPTLPFSDPAAFVYPVPEDDADIDDAGTDDRDVFGEDGFGEGALGAHLGAGS